jgi:hypothetical protein
MPARCPSMWYVVSVRLTVPLLVEWNVDYLAAAVAVTVSTTSFCWSGTPVTESAEVRHTVGS